MGERRTPLLSPPTGGGGLWNQGQIPGGRRPKPGTEPLVPTQAHALRSSLEGLCPPCGLSSCVSAGGYQPVGVREPTLHRSCPAPFSAAAEACRAPSPAPRSRGPSWSRLLRGRCRGPWESSPLAVLALSPPLSTFLCRPLPPRSLPHSPHPPVSPVCPPRQLLGCLPPVSLLLGLH